MESQRRKQVNEWAMTLLDETVSSELSPADLMFLDCYAELTRMEQALEKLRKECERLDADGDKWMNRAAVAEQRLDDLQK